MNDSLLDLWRTALEVAVAVSAPVLCASLAVGVIIAIVQAATQLQDSVLSFVPKLSVALLVLVLSGHWALDKLAKFTKETFVASTQPRPPVERPVTPVP